MATSAITDFIRAEFGDHLRGSAKYKVLLRPYIAPLDDLLAYIPPGSRIFDVGCGSGLFMALAIRFAQPTRVEGIDIDAAALHTAQTILGPHISTGLAHIEQYDGDDLPASVSDADLVFMVDVLHHIPEAAQDDFLGQLFTKMKPGAQLILKDIDAADRVLVLANKFHDFVVSREVGNEMRMRDAEALVEGIGFKITARAKRRMLWYSHFTMACQKD